ncbi:replication-associated protein [Sewage-associated circular DNA virus-13]|uniref:replication-associated protein n=1 Tax=Sewage-associated circular DNA virus-13 TaxID=1519389 RepID=UPI0004D14027|nr:replication-associated protein [Sewage-associated circular DNA virus-13]AIF34803.1 replication-associated protein [Sewage-associated circular DNA virus-13]
MDLPRFRLNNQRLLCTYAKSDLSKKKLKEFFVSKSPKTSPKVKIARESHKDGSKHMHVLVDFGKRFDSTNRRVFDFEGRHPNIRRVESMIHWANLLCYLGKEDKKCRPSASVLAAAKCWNAKTPVEAILSGAYKDPIRSLAVFRQRPSAREFICNMTEPEAPWYQDIVKPLIEANSDHRSWYWFCDKVGNSWKSYTCKYLLQTMREDFRATKLTANVDSFAMKLGNWQQEGWSGKILFVDLARGKANTNTIYECLELTSDGWGDTGKYEGKSFILDSSPIVVVLANWWPRIAADTGSLDRWKLFEITNEPIRGSARCMNLNIVRTERTDLDEELAIQKEVARLEKQMKAAEAVEKAKARIAASRDC